MENQKKRLDEKGPIIQIIGAEVLEREETQRRREGGQKMSQQRRYLGLPNQKPMMTIALQSI